MRLRATLHLRNERMIAARERLGLTQKSLAEAAQVPWNLVQHLERLDYSGYRATVAQHAASIAGILELDPADVLPPDMAGQTIPTTFTRIAEVEPRQLAAAASRMMPALPSPQENVERDELIDAVRNALAAGYSPRERRALHAVALRYGIDNGGKGLILDDLARELGVTRERARQIEQHGERILAKRLAKADV